MTALQVRDFPPFLLEELRAEAEREHRSVSQQTIYFIERGLHPQTKELTDEDEAQRLARQKKRERIFAEARKLPPVDPEKERALWEEIRREREEAMDRAFNVLQEYEAERALSR